ncbi:uncharacterized protein J4E79_006462 [Alternaria viburni]|uniref:uncharacterized protein n=1 Tax=Alternaria viburni TaxID=566460 RepID=UPI0020C1E0F1|nr:uncharacterized protein J4E79_006462 [Alternaria viburni]KAI4658704.1 hypothetical protein J4E79_006462 [Alternaria viburni]
MATPSTPDELNTVMSKITSANQISSPLLRLPAELRNQIYTFVGLSTIIKAIQPEGSLTCSFQVPEQLKACKQIRHEATSIVYRSALFDFTQCNTGVWLNGSCDHSIGEFVTSIKIGGQVACLVSHYIGKGRSYEGLQFPTKWLPNVQKIYIKYDACMQQWGFTTGTAMEVLCKKNTMQIIFV